MNPSRNRRVTFSLKGIRSTYSLAATSRARRGLGSIRSFFPILLAVRDLSRYDVVVFHSYLGWAFHFLRRWFDPQRRMATLTWFHGLEPLYHRAVSEECRRADRVVSRRFRLLHHVLLPRFLKNRAAPV